MTTFSKTFSAVLVAAIIAFSGAAINPAPACAEQVLMVFGDSLTEGTGLSRNEAFPARLEARLEEMGHHVRVINAGVAGETTSAAAVRLDWTLQQKPGYVILELGANDMMRGVPPEVTKANLDKILGILKARKIPVLLAGMKSFINMGPEFGKAYDAMYADLAKKHGVPLYPFFLEGVAFRPEYLNADGLHPNAAGADFIAGKIAPHTEKLLKEGKDGTPHTGHH